MYSVKYYGLDKWMASEEAKKDANEELAGLTDEQRIRYVARLTTLRHRSIHLSLIKMYVYDHFHSVERQREREAENKKRDAARVATMKALLADDSKARAALQEAHRAEIYAAKPTLESIAAKRKQDKEGAERAAKQKLRGGLHAYSAT
jgi:hypothetical protein